MKSAKTSSFGRSDGGAEPDLPDCPSNTPDKCRLTYSGMSQTLLAFEPVYDRKGNRLSADPNEYRQQMACQVCHRAWNGVAKASGPWTWTAAT